MTAEGMMADPMIADVEHVTIADDPRAYCGHPRVGAIYNFGDGELGVAYNKAEVSYQRRDEVGHDFSYFERSRQIIARSRDNGRTWPASEDVVVWERGTPIETLRARLWPEDTRREELDMSHPDACFYFGRSWAGKAVRDEARGDVPLHISFSLRSVDRGRTWERVPTLFAPPGHQQSVLCYAEQPVRLADGLLVVPITGGGGADPRTRKEVMLYSSEDQGLSWDFMSSIAVDSTGVWNYTYPSLVLLPSGRLQCYVMRQSVSPSLANWPCLAYSDDGGLSWSAPRPIGRLGDSPWIARRRLGQFSRPRGTSDPAGRPMRTYEPLASGDQLVRAPVALRLRDGRILVLYGRRKPPFGIGGLASSDEGETWDRHFVLRDDGYAWDVGYPVATQLADGRVFTAYYYTRDGDNAVGGVRFIAGTFFRLAD